eukprot:scaffold43946_cov19-Tisochrysis_lutea.AAC.2
MEDKVDKAAAAAAEAVATQTFCCAAFSTEAGMAKTAARLCSESCGAHIPFDHAFDPGGGVSKYHRCHDFARGMAYLHSRRQ